MVQCPPEGQLVALDSMPTMAGGCAANVAIDLAKQGIPVEIVGCVGRDGAGLFLKKSLEEQGVGCSHLIFAEGAATSKTVILLVEGQDRRYVHYFGANASFAVHQIPRDWVAGLKVFYLGGLCAMPGLKLDELLDLLKFCRSKGVVSVVDVVIPQQFSAAGELCALLPHIDYFLPNDDEASLLTGAKDPAVQMKSLHACGANTVIITQGPAGVMAARGKECWRAGAFSTGVIDPSGAGDAFAAGIITGILRGWSVPKMLRYGSSLGASATRAIGTTAGVFTKSEAEAFVQRNHLEI